MAVTTGQDKDFMIPDAISCLLLVTKTCPPSGSVGEGTVKAHGFNAAFEIVMQFLKFK